MNLPPSERRPWASGGVPRAEAVRKLCRRAADDVAAIVPDGIGRWDRAWDITAAPAAEFCLALKAWEASGASEDRARVGAAYERFVESWRFAVCQFEPHRAGYRDGPVKIIGRGWGGQSFRVPAEDIKTGVRLDLVRVASVTEETRAVARVLREVFDPEGEQAPQAWPIAEERGDGLLGLDKQHSALLALLTRQPRWTTSDLDQAAKELGLLGSGAVELINQASFEVCGEPLLEGREPIEINDYALDAMEAR